MIQEFLTSPRSACTQILSLILSHTPTGLSTLKSNVPDFNLKCKCLHFQNTIQI